MATHPKRPVMDDEQCRKFAMAEAEAAAVDAYPGNTDVTRQTSPLLPRATSPPEPATFTLSLWIPLKMRPSVKSGKIACAEPQGRVVDVERDGKTPSPTPPTHPELSPPPPILLATDALSSVPATAAVAVDTAAGIPEACVEDDENKFARMGARLARRRSIPASRGLPLAAVLATVAALEAEEAKSAAV